MHLRLSIVFFILVGSVAAMGQALGPSRPANPEIQMDLEKLRAEAFQRCQVNFVPPVLEHVAELDPPREGGLNATGLVFQEELAITAPNFLDQQGAYMTARPRAALNWLPMDIYASHSGPGQYRALNFEDAGIDYGSSVIVPPLDPRNLPAAGRVLTEVIVGHQAPAGDFPQIISLRSSAYLRFTGYAPAVMGASLRLGARNVFSLTDLPGFGPREDFPIVRSAYFSVKESGLSHAYVMLENDLFCGALSLDFSAGVQTSIVVDSHWYTRRDYDWKTDRHTGLVAYSSMLWKSEAHMTNHPSGEAHDSDTLRMTLWNGARAKRTLEIPEHGVRFFEYPNVRTWNLANEDKDPAHYADFAWALGETNYNFRSSYRVEILDTNVKTGLILYESKPDFEFGDNIVALTSLRQDVPKAKRVEDSIHFKYRTNSY